jgi:hypothetical protein
LYDDNKKRILAKIENRFNDKLAVIGEIVASAAKLNCPVGQYKDGRVGGRLRSSISWKTSEADGGIESHSAGSGSDAVSKPEKKLTVRIGTNVDYAKYVELGTKRMRRRAMLRLGLYENRNVIKRILNLD